MNLVFDTDLASDYSSPSQIIRVLSENWVHREIYCPNCGHTNITKDTNNKPASDFICFKCREDYELKSKRRYFGKKITDGAYKTMTERLLDSDNPNFFLLNYDTSVFKVSNFFVIPKHFFTPEIIEKRKPLSPTARRANWVGCNIILESIPETGKIFFIKDGQIVPKEKVLSSWQKTLFLREEKETKSKGWLLDIIKCIEMVKKTNFSLSDIYAFEKILSEKHPDNKHIKDKIRQQLQILRDKGYLEFTERGRYILK